MGDMEENQEYGLSLKNGKNERNGMKGMGNVL